MKFFDFVSGKLATINISGTLGCFPSFPDTKSKNNYYMFMINWISGQTDFKKVWFHTINKLLEMRTPFYLKFTLTCNTFKADDILKK